MSGADVSQDWTAAVTQYLLTASHRAARSLDLSYAVLRRVADGSLTVEAARTTIARAHHDHRGEYASDVARISADFFAALVQLAAGSAESPRGKDTSDPTAYADRLSEYARTTLHDFTRLYWQRVDALSSGTATPADVQSALAADYTAALERWRANLALYFNVLSRLANADAAFEQQCIGALLGSAGVDDAPAITLRGPVGARASTHFIVENTRSEPATLTCALLDVRRADGGAPAFAPDSTIHTSTDVLQPGEEAHIEFAIHLDATYFDAGYRYVSVFRLMRDAERPLDMSVAIVPTAPSNALAQR